MILRLFRPSAPGANIRDLYGTSVAQARSSAFYRTYGVPDTVAGRFDLIVLHLVLVLARLERDQGEGGEFGRAVGQRLFDQFCRDMDDNLREMGVGDLAVPRRMRQFAEAFYGRQSVYLAALAASDVRQLANALTRNIFADAAGTDEQGQADGQAHGRAHGRAHGQADGASRLARYAFAVRSQLEGRDKAALEKALRRGEVPFPNPETIPAPGEQTMPEETVQNG